MLRTRRSTFVLGIAALALAPGAAAAGEKDFAVYAPGFGASASQAKPYLDRFGALLEKQLGWKAGTANLVYLDDGKALVEHIAREKPGYALLPPADYLELACAKTPLTPLAAVVGLASTSSSSGRWHVVAKEGTAKDLDGLRGRRLGSNHLHNLRFVSRVVFGGRVDVEKHFGLKPTNSPITPFKWIDRGEADAALVADDQLAHMKTLPFARDLLVVFSSEELPPFSVVAFDKVVKPADRDAVKKAILGLCASTEGAPVCKEMQVTRFVAVDAAAFKPAMGSYCGK